MAERRMFAKSIIDSDAFLEMPVTSQLLYFHLSMRADDDGFINQPKAIMRLVSAKEDDMKVLFAKKFVIPFESGVVVIKHWRINNYIRNDRYKETVYLEEKSQLDIKDNNGYALKKNVGIPTDNQMETQYRLDKDSIDKDSIEIVKNREEINKEIDRKEKKELDSYDSNYMKAYFCYLQKKYPDLSEEQIKQLPQYISQLNRLLEKNNGGKL